MAFGSFDESVNAGVAAVAAGIGTGGVNSERAGEKCAGADSGLGCEVFSSSDGCGGVAREAEVAAQGAEAASIRVIPDVHFQAINAVRADGEFLAVGSADGEVVAIGPVLGEDLEAFQALQSEGTVVGKGKDGAEQGHKGDKAGERKVHGSQRSPWPGLGEGRQAGTGCMLLE